MASAGLLSEEQLLCSICLGVFTDPVTIACGHNYCRTCIKHCWNQPNEHEHWLCPTCKRKFVKKPKVSVNTLISELANLYRKSQMQPDAEPDEVSCDVCVESVMKRRALKSCLVCLTSYCEAHLERHRQVPALKRHPLIDPVQNLENCICQKHDNRPLELFCKTDRTCLCQSCAESEDHKLHQIVSLDDECEGKKAELRETEAEVQRMIQERQLKIQEVEHSVELRRKETEQGIADSAQAFTTLSSFIEEEHKTMEKQAEGFVKGLHGDIAKLKERSAELKQLSDTADRLHLLQNFTSINSPPPTKDWTAVSVHRSSYVGSARAAVARFNQAMEKLRDAARVKEGSAECSG